MSSNFLKQLVVSKTVFHALHDCDEKLCAFVKNYNVVLPHTLAVECVISEPNKDPVRLMRALDKAIKAGANLGYESPELMEIENKTLCPVESIVDEINTRQFRNLIPDINKDTIRQAANHCMQVTKYKIDGLLEYAKIIYENIRKNQSFFENFNKPTQIEERFQKWIHYVDQNNFMRNAIETGFGKHIGSKSDENWYTWQFTRLWYIFCLDRCFKEILYGTCVKKDISNDFYDIEPVLYLLRADGLLTNDKKLEIPLANAAFPKKDVFKVNTSLNAPRTVQHVFDEIISKIPASYKS